MAHTYWRLRGFKADLVILDEEAAGLRAAPAGGAAQADPDPRPVHRDRPAGGHLRPLRGQHPARGPGPPGRRRPRRPGRLPGAAGAAAGPAGPIGEHPRPGPPGRGPALRGGALRPPAVHGAALLQRPGGLLPGRAGVRRLPRPLRPDPGPLGQRDGQPALRGHADRIRAGLRLVPEQPEQPPPALVERPRGRPHRGRHLHPRRPERGLLDAHPPAHPGAGRLPLPPRAGLHHLRAQLPRHRAGADHLRPPGRCGPGRSPEGRRCACSACACATPPPAGAGWPSSATGSGCWGAPARRRRCTSSPRGTPRAAPAPGAQRLPPGLRLPRGASSPASVSPYQLQRRPGRVPGPQRHPRPPRGAGAPGPLRAHRGRPRPLLRPARHPGDRAGAERRGDLPPGPGGERGRGAGRRAPLPRPAAGGRRRCKRPGTGGSASWAPCRWRRPTWRSTSCSTAGCPTRPSPAASGGAPPSTSPGGPSASATSCRTPWPWSTPTPPRPGCASWTPPPTSSRRGTSSTGGTPSPGPGCAPASRTTCCGCPSSPPTTCAPRATADPGRGLPLPGRAPPGGGRARDLLPPGPRRGRRNAPGALPAGDQEGAHRGAATGCP